MYIYSISLRNVRCFEKLGLRFPRPDGSLAGWTVLAGRNGSGKSSLLRALALAAFSVPQEIFRLTDLREWMRRDTDLAQIVIVLGRERPVAERIVTLQKGRVRFDGFPDELPPGGEFGFVAAYGSHRRLTRTGPEPQSLIPESSPTARVLTLFHENASLLESVSWLREVHYRHLDGKPRFATLGKTVLSLLNDGLLPDGIHIEKVDSDGLWARHNDVLLTFMELSDGYRTTTALVLDILRNLHEHFGEVRVERAHDDEGEYLRVLHKGVVLIDEVDLHLHISWQKRIGFWLKRHFPNIQFIVTTHSPFVCQAADPKGLIRLPAPGEDRSAEHVSEDLYNTVVNGSLDEAVLTELFGLETPYSEPAEKLRIRVAHLEARLQTGKATKAEKREYQELSARLPQTPATAVEQALRKLAADA